MVSGALGSAVFSAVTGVLLTRRYPLVLEVRCCEVAAHLHRRQASIRRQDGASLNCSSYYIFLDELRRTPSMRSSTSENSPSTYSGEYQALGVEESKLNSMPILGMPARDMVG